MGKAHKKDKMTYEQKKAAFWAAILTERQRDVREGLVNTGMQAQTRNEDGLTSIMLAALNGKVKSLDTLLDYYERRRELRRKGWIDIRDDNGRTALMMAAAAGRTDAVYSLLLKDAKLELKDDNGMSARDHAEKKQKADVLKLFDEWTAESEEEIIEDDDGNVISDGLTSRERSKLKKKMLQEQEGRGKRKNDGSGKAEDDGEETEDDGAPGPTPIWPEVSKVIESVETLRPVHEISVVRDEEEANLPGAIDPALWYLRTVNRLALRLAPNVLTSIEGGMLARMRKLQTLILSDNALTSLPEEIGKLRHLKVLEVARNQLEALPASLNKCTSLEVLDASSNKISDVSPLNGLQALTILNLSQNKLTNLDLDWDNLTRLHDLIVSYNEIVVLPEEVAQLPGLMEIMAENNKIEEIPPEISQLKKITVFKMDGNPIKDPRVRRMCAADNQRKDLWKYLQKQAGGKGGKKGGKKKGGKKKGGDDDDEDDVKPPKAPAKGDEDDGEDDGFESDDSFDITMEEL